jgi:hypothetical protein
MTENREQKPAPSTGSGQALSEAEGTEGRSLTAISLAGLPAGGGLGTAAQRKCLNSSVPVAVIGTPYGELKELL